MTTRAAAVDEHARRRGAQPRRAAGDDERAARRVSMASAPAAADCGLALTTVIAVAMSPATSATFAGTISVLLVLREIARTRRCTARRRAGSPPACRPALRSPRRSARIAFAFASAIASSRRRLALRVVDLGLLLAFGLRDRRLARAAARVDLLLPPALGRRDHRALLALGGDLRLHRAQDLRRRRQVLDLVAQHLDAPVRRRLRRAPRRPRR